MHEHDPFEPTSTSVSVLLGGPSSPYRMLYDQNTFKAEQNFLKDLGYSGVAATYAVNLVHDTGVEASGIYMRAFQLGMTPQRVRVPGRATRRAVITTIQDVDYFRSKFTSDDDYWNRVSYRAAADLLLMKAGQPPLYE